MLDDVTPHTAKFFSSDLDDSQKSPDRGQFPPNPARGAATGAGGKLYSAPVTFGGQRSVGYYS